MKRKNDRTGIWWSNQRLHIVVRERTIWRVVTLLLSCVTILEPVKYILP